MTQHNINEIEYNLTSMLTSIEDVLNAGCESLGLARGMLLLFKSDEAKVIATSGALASLAPAHVPPLSVKASCLPLSHREASDTFTQWAKLFFGTAFFVRGKLHSVGEVTMAMFFFDPFDSERLKDNRSGLKLLDHWLDNVIKQVVSGDTPRKQSALYEKLQNVANIGTWEVDVINQILTWSSQTRVIHEVPEAFEPQLDTAIGFYKEGHDRNEITKLVAHALETGEPWSATLQIVTFKGNEVWVKTHGMVEMVNGQCVRIFGTFQNVDKAVKLRLELDARRQEAEIAFKERDLLLSRVSHELRTPLNGIIGMLQAIKSEQGVKIRERKTDFALRSADRLLQLINDVLDYTEIANGRLVLHNSDFCIQTLLDSLLDEFRAVCEEKGIVLDATISFSASSYVFADAGRIRQIVTHLLSNALKFTPSGSITLKLSLRDRAGALELSISVEDTGEGMSPLAQETLFKPLIQGDNASSATEGQTGLGLSIVKQLVDKMGGELTFYSRLCEGTRFDIVLPVLSSTKNHDVDISPPLLNEPLSILVVDDNDINRIVLTSMLDTYNYKADEAENGEIAISKARQKKYDIIFMDCAMPVLDGVSATKVIVNEGLLGEHGRVVAVTANTTEEDRKACKEAGMNAFLSKPVDQTAVSLELKTVLWDKNAVSAASH